MEIAEDQAEKLKLLGAVEIIDRWGAKYLLFQSQFFQVSSEDTDKVSADVSSTQG